MTIPIFYHPSYSALSLPEGHRFPIEKYQLLYQFIKHELSDQFRFITPAKASLADISKVHCKMFVEQFVTGTLEQKSVRKMGFPWSQPLVERTLYSIGASIQGAKLALETQIASQLSGGYHHSFPSFGSGFCIFNDLVIAARHLLDHNLVSKVVILDLDVHQGDGSAVCAEKMEDVVTISLHCEQNFPAKKQCSDYDFTLNKDTNDQQYQNMLQQCLLTLLVEQPDIVLYNGGADIYSGDELGYLDISLEGVKQREQSVLSFCLSHGIPIFTTSGGGYQRDIANLVEVHKQLYLSMVNA